MNLLLGTPFLAGFAALLGLAVGSFLNVVIYRVPAGLSVAHPPSACPGCGHLIRHRDNVPVLGWLLLRGRCRDCAEPISARYPIIEAVTGALFGAVTLLVASDVWVLAAALVLTAACVALAVIDLDCGRLPFPITAAAAVGCGVLLGAGWVLGAVSGDVPFSVVSVVVGALVWVAVYGLIWFATAGRGMGLGDVALAPLLGAVLATTSLGASVVGLAAGFVVGSLLGLPKLLRRSNPGGGTAIPFGPSMILGAGLALAVGDQIALAYLAVSGLS